MPWQTQLGTTLEWPFKLHAAIVRSKKVNIDQVVEILNEAKRIHDEALKMDAEIRRLKEENLKLKHENEFMLKLINAKDE